MQSFYIKYTLQTNYKFYFIFLEGSTPILRMTVPDSKVTSLIWGTLDNTIITGHEDGAITQWDLRVCEAYKNYIHIIKYLMYFIIFLYRLERA